MMPGMIGKWFPHGDESTNILYDFFETMVGVTGHQGNICNICRGIYKIYGLSRSGYQKRH